MAVTMSMFAQDRGPLDPLQPCITRNPKQDKQKGLSHFGDAMTAQTSLTLVSCYILHPDEFEYMPRNTYHTMLKLKDNPFEPSNKNHPQSSTNSDSVSEQLKTGDEGSRARWSMHLRQ